MAGALTISTLNNDTGVLQTQNGMTGIAKAWVNFDGTTATPSTIRSSFNVSSITNNGTGDYTINFTTSMPDTNYIVFGTSQAADTSADISIVSLGVKASGNIGSSAPASKLTSSVRVYARYLNLTGTGPFNPGQAYFAIFSS